MQIYGEWHSGDDSVERPVIRGEILASDGVWVPVLFLVDTGADRTVFSAAILAQLQLQIFGSQERLGGVDGAAERRGAEITDYPQASASSLTLLTRLPAVYDLPSVSRYCCNDNCISEAQG